MIFSLSMLRLAYFEVRPTSHLSISPSQNIQSKHQCLMFLHSSAVGFVLYFHLSVRCHSKLGAIAPVDIKKLVSACVYLGLPKLYQHREPQKHA